MVCGSADVICILSEQGWLTISIAALLFSYFLVAIAYMISKGFHLPALEAWAKLEYRELVVSVIIIAALGFGLSLVDATTYTLAGADSITFANDYLDRTADNMLGIYEQLNLADRYIAKMTSFYYFLAVPIYLASASISHFPYTGISVLSSMVAVGLDALAASIFIQLAQKMLLNFFQDNSFRWFLPLGIILRTFGFTRKLGGTLIAIAIGTLVVFPLAIAFSAGVYDSVAQDIHIDLPPEPPDLQDTAICNPHVQNFMWMGTIGLWLSPIGPCAVPCQASLTGWWPCMLACFPKAQMIYNAANQVFLLAYAPVLWEYVSSTSVDQIFDPMTNPEHGALAAISHNAMITAVLAVFSIILTISATRALSIQLGGDSQFYGIYKML